VSLVLDLVLDPGDRDQPIQQVSWLLIDLRRGPTETIREGEVIPLFVGVVELRVALVTLENPL
jgi:hypothetical protein